MANRLVWTSCLGKIFPQLWPQDATASAGSKYLEGHANTQVLKVIPIASEHEGKTLGELACIYPAPGHVTETVDGRNP